MRLLKLITACVALWLGTATAHAQFLPQSIGEWEATATFRALDRPNPTNQNQVVFSDFNTGATLLDSNTLIDLNIGLGTDIAFSTTREDGMDYELRFFFNSFSRETLTQANAIFNPFLTGPFLPNQVNSRYTDDMFSIELNQKRILNPYFRVLHGIRFMHIDEELTFLSNGNILGLPVTSTLVTRAKNPMLGYQLGGETRLTLVPGMDWTGYFKAGVYNNFSNQSTTTSINIIPGQTVTSGSENALGFVSDFGCKFHLIIVEDFMSMFAGYDGMFVNSFAAAPTNVNVSSAVVNDLNFWVHGITIGFKVTR